MTPEQLRDFERTGVARLRGAVDPAVARGIRERVWARAEEKLGVRRDDPSAWRRVAPALVADLKRGEGLFDPMLGPAVCPALDALLGAGRWIRPQPLGNLLMTPPDARTWRVPHQAWHTDAPAPGRVDAAVPGVQLFLLLDRVEPRGGATLVAAGSWRLVRDLPARERPDYPGRSADLRRALRARVPWLRALWQAGAEPERSQRFVERESDHEGVPLRVLELTGEPGDVYAMHVWTLHTAAPNTSGRMRMMVNAHVFRGDQQLWSPRGG